jgi:hypothetical protein
MVARKSIATRTKALTAVEAGDLLAISAGTSGDKAFAASCLGAAIPSYIVPLNTCI